MKKQIAALSAVTAALALLVTGCTGSAPDAKQTPTAGPSSAAAQEETYNECIDGRATVLASDVERGGEITLGDCDEVSVVGAAAAGSSIELGAVKLLVIEADGATVRAGAVGRIVVPGAHNTVTHTGEATVDDQGVENTVTKS
ncbi:hypothetical protein [Curtobacterium sp. MCSS17_015]|uniref:hypothetical protein n=1 Tax=Curtobacterium sp. MCSS17_015 TaxID=2175666 RepID=UPI000DA9EBE1|nr:hypothetical protein [Curtobacterium sp. MCSS17_015]WIB26927.1 hypothetical protein DEJ18_02200 [Curtobacterium sp. MCSS17_015]